MNINYFLNSKFNSSLLIVSLIFSTNAFALDKEQVGKECYDLLHSEDAVDSKKLKECRDKALSYPTPVNLVITPTRRPENAREVAASVAVVSPKELERSAPNSAAEALRRVPGVQIADAGQAGFKRVRIRGEESRRVAVLIDGQEFVDQREVGTPLLIAPEMVEQIEVVRGTGSVLHGSRAIGGVVNFITKKGGYHPLQGTLSTTFDSATDGYQLFGSLFGRSNGFEYRAAGTIADHNNRETPDGEVDNTAFENNSYSLFLSKEFGNHTIGISHDDFNASSDVYVDPAVANAPPFIDFRIEAPQRDRAKTSVFYDGENLSELVSSVHLDFYYQQSDREFNTFPTLALGPIVSATSNISDSSLDTLGTNGQVDLALSDNNHLITGFEIKHDDLEQQRKRTVTRDGVAGPLELTNEKASQATYELFAEDAWNVSEDLEVRAGLRGIYIDSELEETNRAGISPNSTSDEHLVGAAGLKYTGIKDVTLWTGWSQGYVAPSLINLGTGAFAGSAFVSPNPDLNPETSNSFDLGARITKRSYMLDASVFITDARDYIDHVLCSSTSTACIAGAGRRDRVYENIDEARTFGAEASAALYLDSVTPYTSLSWVRRKYERDSISTYDTGLPEFTSRTGVEVRSSFSDPLELWADAYVMLATDSDELDGSDVLHTAGWGTTNLAFGAVIGAKRELKLSVELLNLGDKRYTTSTENLLARGRSAVVKMTLDL